MHYKVLTRLLGEQPDSEPVIAARQAIPDSPRVAQQLSERQAGGKIPHHAYDKWRGAHWVLALLADLDYPPGDDRLFPLREQVFDWLFSEKHQQSIRTLNGRVRRCASQEGNALYAMLKLGLADERTEILAQRLRQWQWPDGGWNCDKRPEASNSSFMESLIPLRALALHARLNGDEGSRLAAQHAAEIFLKRRLFKRQRDGSLIFHEFVRLHYPCYWHYDILFALKVMAEAGFLGDERCQEALQILKSKQLPGGGFPAEAKYYTCSANAKGGRSLVDWGGTGVKRTNEFVTVEALCVLKAAGELL